MLVFKPCENFLPLLLPSKITTTTNSKPHLHHHHHHHLHRHVKLHFSPKAHFKSTFSSSPLSSPPDSSPPPPPDSSSLITADFLMYSGGLSYGQAIHVIREVPSLLRNGGRKPRSVIAYLESIGFSKTHISKLISKFPRVLVSDVEETLKPQIQLFQDFGFSESDIADLIASKPSILTRGVKTPMKPNMDVLRQHGVPDSEIVHLISSQLQTLMWTPKVFKIIVERIVSLGFKPETRKFSTAVAVMSRMNKASWDSKIDLLKGLGWSEVQILDAFRRHPMFLALSRQNLKESIEFYAESMNWDASILSNSPEILGLSLKIRVIPRYAVLKCLMSKKIIKEDKFIVSMLTRTETQFLSRYVFKYQDQLPYLYEV